MTPEVAHYVDCLARLRDIRENGVNAGPAEELLLEYMDKYWFTILTPAMRDAFNAAFPCATKVR